MQNTGWPNIWASCVPVKLIHKINHFKYVTESILCQLPRQTATPLLQPLLCSFLLPLPGTYMPPSWTMRLWNIAQSWQRSLRPWRFYGEEPLFQPRTIHPSLLHERKGTSTLFKPPLFGRFLSFTSNSNLNSCNSLSLPLHTTGWNYRLHNKLDKIPMTRKGENCEKPINSTGRVICIVTVIFAQSFTTLLNFSPKITLRSRQS